MTPESTKPIKRHKWRSTCPAAEGSNAPACSASAITRATLSHLADVCCLEGCVTARKRSSPSFAANLDSSSSARAESSPSSSKGTPD
jgi:hypothetical protein